MKSISVSAQIESNKTVPEERFIFISLTETFETANPGGRISPHCLKPSPASLLSANTLNSEKAIFQSPNRGITYSPVAVASIFSRPFVQSIKSSFTYILRSDRIPGKSEGRVIQALKEIPLPVIPKFSTEKQQFHISKGLTEACSIFTTHPFSIKSFPIETETPSSMPVKNILQSISISPLDEREIPPISNSAIPSSNEKPFIEPEEEHEPSGKIFTPG